MDSISLEKYTIVILIIHYLRKAVGEMEGYVVGGDHVEIEQYPHSALLEISCNKDDMDRLMESYRCGSSIINQDFTLTAAHCVADCNNNRSHVAVVVGHEHRNKGVKSSARTFIVHNEFNYHPLTSDIALIQLKTPLGLNSRVKRVALLSSSQISFEDQIGYVAGWGLVDDNNHIGTEHLKHLRQPVWSRESCTKFLRNLPAGCLCAGYKKGNNYAAPGDSGSALIIKNYMQIGIVSYKNPSKSKSLIIYTDVGYYHDWIKAHAKRSYCTTQNYSTNEQNDHNTTTTEVYEQKYDHTEANYSYYDHSEVNYT